MAAVTETVAASGAKRATATKTSGLSGVFALARAYFQRRRKIIETIRELESMSDRELNDIGVSRYDIRRIAEESI